MLHVFKGGLPMCRVQNSATTANETETKNQRTNHEALYASLSSRTKAQEHSTPSFYYEQAKRTFNIAFSVRA
jgi:hypothetical protein